MNARARAAPDEEGMMFSAAARASHRLVGQHLGIGAGMDRCWGLSTRVAADDSYQPARYSRLRNWLAHEMLVTRMLAPSYSIFRAARSETMPRSMTSVRRAA
jgi:hypothetical protein